MYECEFNQIWEAQIAYYPESLTPALQKQIGQLLFFQRPIAAQGHLIGKCELEPNERRASWATLEAQRFRILQKVNDLQIIYPGKPSESRGAVPLAYLSILAPDFMRSIFRSFFCWS
jgi:CRISPR-associated endonuclease Csn1